jgi:xanthine/CO dehydrogenase XdhC/CoxF family maturation factor
VNHSIAELCRFFESSARKDAGLVIATVLRTEGSTYRKAGARALIDVDGRASGMLSGGCLEADLHERAARTLARSRPERVWFDTRTSEDPIWGIGSGCEGAVDIWLQPESPRTGFAFMRYLQRCLADDLSAQIATVVGGEARPEELGTQAFRGQEADDPLSACLAAALLPSVDVQLRSVRFEERSLEVFVGTLALPPRLLICGAGFDAIPVHDFAAALGWQVTVFDHRPAYANTAQFPLAARVVCARAEELPRHLNPASFDAAVVMSHHLPADIAYLQALAAQPPRYIGLLGPAARRQRLLAEAGSAARDIAPRIHGPAGLDIGAGTPEAIALAIVAQIQAALSGRAGGPFDADRRGAQSL